jgi:hypothetical protein
MLRKRAASCGSMYGSGIVVDKAMAGVVFIFVLTRRIDMAPL